MCWEEKTTQAEMIDEGADISDMLGSDSEDTEANEWKIYLEESESTSEENDS